MSDNKPGKQDSPGSRLPRLDDFAAPGLWIGSFALLWWLFGKHFVVVNGLPLLAVFMLVAGRYTVLPWVNLSVNRQCPNSYTVHFGQNESQPGLTLQRKNAVTLATYWLDFSSTAGGAFVTLVAFLRLAILTKNDWTIFFLFLCGFLFLITVFYLALLTNPSDWRDDTRIVISYYGLLPELARKLLRKRGREGRVSFLGKSAARVYWLRSAFLVMFLVAVVIASRASSSG